MPLRRLDELLTWLAEDVEYIELTRTEPSDGKSYKPDLQEFLEEVRARYDGFYCYDCDAMNSRVPDYREWVNAGDGDPDRPPGQTAIAR